MFLIVPEVLKILIILFNFYKIIHILITFKRMSNNRFKKLYDDIIKIVENIFLEEEFNILKLLQKNNYFFNNNIRLSLYLDIYINKLKMNRLSEKKNLLILILFYHTGTQI